MDRTSPGQDSPAKAASAKRLAALRRELAAQGVDGFLVPRSDEHQGEYVPPHAERLAWLTGFKGSAGFAAVLKERAAVFVDGRYTLQVREEINLSLFEALSIAGEGPRDWIAAQLGRGKLGFDPWLHTRAQVRGFESMVARAGGELVALAGNPIDAVWADRPEPPRAPARPHPLEFAGRCSAEKRAEVAATLKDQGAEAAVLTLPDSIAWLLNLRGGDVGHTPLVLSFAILYGDGRVDWFVDGEKLDDAVLEWLGPEVAPQAPAAFGTALDGLSGKRVLADSLSAAEWIFRRLEAAGAKILDAVDPCQLPKACKNPVELEGARRAHTRDGAAVTRFLAWLAREGAGRAGSNDPVMEIEAAEKLESFRRTNPELRDLSFDTISGAGPHGAVVHYRVDAESNRALGDGELYLVDSGGQYPDGTTDVTRTVAIGAPSAEMRERFTRVLKGHIALATAQFPQGTTGSALDALARLPLWQAGLDFDHGTGHGVGSYLGVHEGPQRISKLPNKVALEPGMIVSNEPGYYKEGAYGIRIENLVAVVEAKVQGEDSRPMLAFETLTLAPLDRQLIDLTLLNQAERAWIDAYHARVCETLAPRLAGEDLAWLEESTRPLAD
ncbi:MAG: aminopeptidase P family protein [Rhodovibrionaceae bacterium]